MNAFESDGILCSVKTVEPTPIIHDLFETKTTKLIPISFHYENSTEYDYYNQTSLFTKGNSQFLNVSCNSSILKEELPLSNDTITKRKIIAENKLKLLYKSNKRISKKIEKVLSFLKVHSNFINEELTRSLLESKKDSNSFDNYDTTKLKLSQKNLLTEIRMWSGTEEDHKKIMDLLENYKKLIKQFMNALLNKTDRFNDICNALSEKEDIHSNKRKTKRINKKAFVWNAINSYFTPIHSDVRRDIKSLISSSNEEFHKEEFELLNIVAVNRLSAIAKMLQYCNENKIAVGNFMKDRIEQKLKTRLKQKKLLDHSIQINETLPTMNEVSYLSSIKNSNINFVIDTLKYSLLNWNSKLEPTIDRYTYLENNLKIITNKNNSRLKLLQERIRQKISLKKLKLNLLRINGKESNGTYTKRKILEEL